MCELTYTFSRKDGESYAAFKSRAELQAAPFGYALNKHLSFRVVWMGEQKEFHLVKPPGMDCDTFGDLVNEFTAYLRIAIVNDLKASEFPVGTYNFSNVIFDDDETIKLIYTVVKVNKETKES